MAQFGQKKFFTNFLWSLVYLLAACKKDVFVGDVFVAVWRTWRKGQLKGDKRSLVVTKPP